MKNRHKFFILTGLLMASAMILTVMMSSCQQKVTIHKHEYSSWETDVHPTCTEDGTFMRKCKECEHSEVTSVPALGHVYDSGQIIIASTCTERGQTNYTCTLCGIVKKTISDKASHKTTDEYSSNETHHGFLCTECDTLTKKEAHFFGEDGLCIICNAEQTE